MKATLPKVLTSQTVRNSDGLRVDAKVVSDEQRRIFNPMRRGHVRDVGRNGSPLGLSDVALAMSNFMAIAGILRYTLSRWDVVMDSGLYASFADC